MWPEAFRPASAIAFVQMLRLEVHSILVQLGRASMKLGLSTVHLGMLGYADLRRWAAFDSPGTDHPWNCSTHRPIMRSPRG